MTLFRRPRTHAERKADKAVAEEQGDVAFAIRGRRRSGRSGKTLPTERDDKLPAALSDRARGKVHGHAAERAAKRGMK